MKVFEHFICQQCSNRIEHDGYYDCEKRPELNGKISFNSIACKDFEPKIDAKDYYEILMLKERVEKLEKIVNMIPEINEKLKNIKIK